jgi:hypothetical protein
LSEGSSIPITLHSDLIRLTKLAKVGQVELVASVQQCCAGSTSDPFTPTYTSGLESVVSSTQINGTAVAATVENAGALGGGSGTTPTPTTSLAGRLINNGGITGCTVGGPWLLDDDSCCCSRYHSIPKICLLMPAPALKALPRPACDPRAHTRRC